MTNNLILEKTTPNFVFIVLIYLKVDILINLTGKLVGELN